MNIETIVKELIAEATAPLICEINMLKTQINELTSIRNGQDDISEVEGSNNAMKALGVNDQHIVSNLLKTGVLGSALWKTPTQRGNGKVFCTPALARKRYRAYLNMPVNVRKEWEQRGSDACELRWQELKL